MNPENSHAVEASVEAQSPVEKIKERNKSTGPRRLAGKRISSLNALKHGAFSKEIIREHLDPHDRKSYTQFLRGLLESYRPQGAAELFQVELMAHFRHSYLCVLRLSRALSGDATRNTTKDVFVEGSASELEERWRLDVPPLDLLEKFHRAEHHCIHHYNRAAAELERLQQMQAGEKVTPRIALDVNT